MFPATAIFGSLREYVFVGLGGVALLIYGLRGRREGDEPHCRKCSYNLTGLTSPRCPECGSSVAPNGVLYGVYRPRWRMLVYGALPLALGVWMLGGVGYQNARTIDLRRCYPVGWLMRDLLRGDRLSFYELTRRERNGELSSAELKRFMDLALSEHENSSTSIQRSTWVNLLTRWDVEGRLTDEQSTRFHEGFEDVRVNFRGPLPLKVRSGGSLRLPLVHEVHDPYPIRLVGAHVRVGGEVLAVVWSSTFWRNAGQARFHDLPTEIFNRSFGGAVLIPRVDLGPGNYSLTYYGRYEVYHPRGSDNDVTNHAWTEEKTVTGSLEVLPAFDPSQIRLLSDPLLEAKLRKAVTLEQVEHHSRPDGPGIIFLRFGVRTPLPVDMASAHRGHQPRPQQVYTPLPVDLACAVILRLPEGETRLGTVLWTKHDGPLFCEFVCPALRDVDEVTVILRPDPQAARDAWDISEIWGGELVFDGVRVHH
ncbi:MAG: hypothetical protein V2A79_03710 [Planctomycetota bacterium]